jgi:hypothetical protein
VRFCRKQPFVVFHVPVVRVVVNGNTVPLLCTTGTSFAYGWNDDEGCSPLYSTTYNVQPNIYDPCFTSLEIITNSWW